MNLADRQKRVLDLYRLRRNINQQIAELERDIEREEAAMRRARDAARAGLPAVSDEMRAGHASYVRGNRDDNTRDLERQYQALTRRRARILKKANAA